VNAAVTGATGFVGKRLVERLIAEGWTVSVLSRSPDKARAIFPTVNVVAGDLTDPSYDFAHFVKNADVIFHCAGEIRDEGRMPAVHVQGTRRLIDAARGRVRRWVQCSSCGVYGPVRQGVVTEDSPLNPVGVYEQTKLESERMIIQAAAEGAFSAAILRPSIIYGEDMPNESVRSWIKAVERGLFFFIGKPGARANYVHVHDVVAALIRCATSPVSMGPAVYNLSNGCTVEEAVAILCAALNRPLIHARVAETPARWLAAVGSLIPGFPLSPSRVDALTVRTEYSASRIQEELGFFPHVSMHEGFSRMVLQMNPQAR